MDKLISEIREAKWRILLGDEAKEAWKICTRPIEGSEKGETPPSLDSAWEDEPPAWVLVDVSFPAGPPVAWAGMEDIEAPNGERWEDGQAGECLWLSIKWQIREWNWSKLVKVWEG